MTTTQKGKGKHKSQYAAQNTPNLKIIIISVLAIAGFTTALLLWNDPKPMQTDPHTPHQTTTTNPDSATLGQ